MLDIFIIHLLSEYCSFFTVAVSLADCKFCSFMANKAEFAPVRSGLSAFQQKLHTNENVLFPDITRSGSSIGTRSGGVEFP